MDSLLNYCYYYYKHRYHYDDYCKANILVTTPRAKKENLAWHLHAQHPPASPNQPHFYRGDFLLFSGQFSLLILYLDVSFFFLIYF